MKINECPLSLLTNEARLELMSIKSLAFISSNRYLCYLISTSYARQLVHYLVSHLPILLYLLRILQRNVSCLLSLTQCLLQVAQPYTQFILTHLAGYLEKKRISTSIKLEFVLHGNNRLCQFGKPIKFFFIVVIVSLKLTIHFVLFMLHFFLKSKYYVVYLLLHLKFYSIYMILNRIKMLLLFLLPL